MSDEGCDEYSPQIPNLVDDEYRQNQPAVPFAGEGFLTEKKEEIASKIKTTLLLCKNTYC